MPTMLSLHLEGEGCWPDLQGDPEKLTWLGHKDAPAEPIQMALLTDGTSGGKPSVAIRMDLPNGQVIVGETTWALFLSAAQMFEAKLREAAE